MASLLRRKKCVAFLAVIVSGLFAVSSPAAEKKLDALIVDGQNNHGNWPQTTQMMKKYLEQTGLFDVAVATTAPKGTDPNFHPDFSKYDVVVSNYNGAEWPKETRDAFIQYLKNGGGLVIVHAADNAFGNWKEYNEIIGLGGWGGRNEQSGPYVYLAENGETHPRCRQRRRRASRGAASVFGRRQGLGTPHHQRHAPRMDARQR